jgi:hypothetical protein
MKSNTPFRWTVGGSCFWNELPNSNNKLKIVWKDIIDIKSQTL